MKWGGPVVGGHTCSLIAELGKHAVQGVHREHVRGRRGQDAVLPQPPTLPRGDVDTKEVRWEAEDREGGS